MRRRKKRGQNCRDKTLFIIIIIILFSSRAKRLLIIVHYVCCGDGDGSPIGKKKHYHSLLLLLLFPRVSNVRAGERQSRRSRCVVVAVVVSGFDLSFFPFSREKPLSRLALVSLLPLLFGKMMIVFFLIYRAQNTFTRKKCTRSETFRRRNLSTGWASRVVSRLRRAFPFLR